MANCSADYYDYGGTDSSKFGEPLPWIGLYVALASLVCLVLIHVDMHLNFGGGRPWIASKFFAFNATTLTLLALATKIPSDITGAMPGLVDQLTKLSGLIFLCVAMDHAMPSLGAMDGLAASSSMIALGIMVVSMFVNLWIQLNSGLIFKYYFRYIYICYSLNMLLLFLFLVFHTLSVFPSRRILYKQYCKLHQGILNEISQADASVRFSHHKLDEYVTKYWLMATTSSPVYTLNTSELAIASSCLNAYLFCIIFVSGTSFLIHSKLKHGNKLGCFVRSDYSWSTWLIFLIQVLAIITGGVATSQRISRSKLSIKWRNLFKLDYRIKFMMDWNDKPLPLWISNKQIRKFMHKWRGMSINALITLQFLVITISRIMLIFGLFLMKRIRVRIHWGTTRASLHGDMSEYVLYLEDEKDDEHSKRIARFLQKYPTVWIDRGGANQPANLDRLLRDYSLEEAFEEVYEFYSQQIPPAGLSREPLNCWALPIVTLASILYATSPRREHLRLAVGESLRYIRLVDQNLDERGTRRMQKAADIAWEKLYLQNRWMNFNFDKTNSMSFSDLITELHREAESDIHQDEQCNNSEDWPQKAFITNCMYTTTGTILKSQTGGSPSNLAWSVERLEKVMVGLLGACLTNLPLAILKHCSSGTFGLREGKVRKAATILGETRTIIMLLENCDLEVNYPEKKEYFESWYSRPLISESYV